jgi:hypothetical protein
VPSADFDPAKLRALARCGLCDGLRRNTYFARDLFAPTGVCKEMLP